MMLLQATDADNDSVNSFAACAEDASSRDAKDASDIKVEQNKIAGSIQTLINKYESVCPAQVSDGLPRKRPIFHAIPPLVTPLRVNIHWDCRRRGPFLSRRRTFKKTDVHSRWVISWRGVAFSPQF